MSSSHALTRRLAAFAVASLLTGASLVEPAARPVAAATTYVVTSTADAGSCPGGSGNPGYSLRCAIAAVNAAKVAATIQFSIPTSDPGCSGTPSVCTISPGSGLPTLSVGGTTIDGYSQPGAAPNTSVMGAAGNARIAVRIDGGAAPPGYSGLIITAPNVTVDGLSLTNWVPDLAVGSDGVGIVVTGAAARGDRILGNYIGVAPNGTTVAGNDIGVSELNGASGLLVGDATPAGRNLIGGSAEAGILLDVGRQNVVQGNYIGTNVAGTSALPNNDGVDLFAQGTPGTPGTGSTIGGGTASAGNVISGNTRYGVLVGLIGTSSDAYTVIGANVIGLNAPGKSALPNARGVLLDRAKYTTVGGPGVQANVIAGNSADGVTITDGGVSNLVTNNFIGTTSAGAKVGNGGNGVLLAPTSLSDRIANNTIANNKLAGVQVGSGSSDNVHTAISMNSMFGNLSGISLAGQSPSTCLSGPTTGTPNDYTPCPLIKFATTSQIVGEACAGCTVEIFIAPSKTDDEGKTYLGTATPNCGSPCTGIGQWTLPSSSYAVPLSKGQVVVATATTGTVPVETSMFSRAAVVGQPIVVTTTADTASPCPSNAVSLRCAIIKVNGDGSGDTVEFAIPSTDAGCSGTPRVCTIAPASPLPHLLAAGAFINGYTQPGATPNTNGLTGGDNATLTVRLDGSSAGQSADGLFLTNSNQGVSGLAVLNFRGSSAGNGIRISGPAAAGDLIQGNLIGLDVNGATAGPNNNGVLVTGGAGTATIGGRALGDANVIGGNKRYGVELSQGSKSTVLENLIGTTAAGTGPLGNGLTGVFLFGTTANIIGGSWPFAGNVISGNLSDGIDGVNASLSTIAQNTIGANGAGTAPLGNGLEGVYLYAGNNNLVGGSASTGRNIISGNGGDGVALLGEYGDVVTGNRIGASASNGPLPNQAVGVLVGDPSSASSAPNHAYLPTVQPDSAGANPSTATISLNTIANNLGVGVQIGQSVYESTVHAVISQNSMKLNGGPGIDLTGSPLACGGTSPAPGPNDMLPCPTISNNSTKTQITGSACVGCVVEVFKANSQADDAGYGEGLTYLGSTVQGAGIPYWTLTLPSGVLSNGDTITTTATLPANESTPGETSQFSANFTFPNPT